MSPYLPALIAGLVAVLGWLAVERFARARERRSDIRALISNFGEQVDMIISEAIRYYALPGNAAEAGALATVLKAKIQSLQDHLDVLREAGLAVEFSADLKRFRQSVTGGDFESSARVSQPAASQLAYSITASGQALVGTVRIKLYRELAKVGAWKRSTRT